MSEWRQKAIQAISAAHENLPENAPFDDRVKALHDAYPFGLRRQYPYKVWLEEQRKYLSRYDPKPAVPLLPPISPLEKAKKAKPLFLITSKALLARNLTPPKGDRYE